MMNLPYDGLSMSQVAGCQNVPVQTGQNNFQSYQQQPQTASQQMQAGQPSAVCPGNPQGQNQHAFNVFQPDLCSSAYPLPFGTNPPINQNPRNLSPSPQAHLHNCTTTLPQCAPDQFRGCLPCAAPIFIIPSGCQVPQQSTTSAPNYGPVPFSASYPTLFPTSYPIPYPAPMPAQQTVIPHIPPQSIYCPPSFYPFPIPMPMYGPDSFSGQGRAKDKQSCDCSRRTPEPIDIGIYSASYGGQSGEHRDEHRCTYTDDDTVCSKRNCPLSISLQALAAQLLSMQGIVPCAAVRLILRKVPGSNVTTSIEDTMERAQNSVSVLTKDQLLAESRYAQQVNALINLHMTTNPPLNLIPILTLIQLKVNVLKAHVESLISKKVMENQGVEVEATNTIEPALLVLKTDNELRELFTLLRQKECDERVNLNFSPYRSQRVIAEMRLKNVQNKIRQIEAEFDRRRCTVVPGHSLSYRTLPQCSDGPTTHSGVDSTFNESRMLPVSPDPFSVGFANPKRLILRPHVGSRETTYDRTYDKVASNVKCEASTVGQSSKNVDTQGEAPSSSNKIDAECQDDRARNQNETEGKNRTEDDEQRNQCQECQKNRQDYPRRSPSRSTTDSSSCDDSSTDESLTEAKKKLRASLDEMRDAIVSGVDRLKRAHGTKPCRLKRGTGKSDETRVKLSSNRFQNSFLKERVIGESGSIDRQTAENSTAAQLTTNPKAATGIFNNSPVCRDGVFEIGEFANCTLAETQQWGEMESGWKDPVDPAGIELPEREEKIVMPATEKSSEGRNNQRSDDSAKSFFKTKTSTKDNIEVKPNVLTTEPTESTERTGKFVNVVPTIGPDEETDAYSHDAEAVKMLETGAENEKPSKTRYRTTKTIFIGDPERKFKKILKFDRSRKEVDAKINVTEDARSPDSQMKLEKTSDSVTPSSTQTAGKKNVKSELFVKLDTKKRTNGAERVRQDFDRETENAAGSSKTKDEPSGEKQLTEMEAKNRKAESSDEVQPRKDLHKSEWSMKIDSSGQGARTNILKPFEKTLALRMTRKSKDGVSEKK